MLLNYNELIEKLENSNIQKHIDKLAKKYKNKKILIYGSGTMANYILDKYDLTELNIIGISDIKYQSKDKDFKGIKIIPFSEISTLKPSMILIFIYDYIEVINFFKLHYPEICKIDIIHIIPKNAVKKFLDTLINR